ncbi:MAG: FAD-dependent monooxygenase [Acidimicrobiales bacterium]|nr:FAD-dependent monooxygenase [Acidimicrobiales bacterium]
MARPRILVIGAGVAGLTLAGLLRSRPVDVDLVERAPADDFDGSGYMLGLLPLGGRVLTELGLRDEYHDRSIQMERYRIHAADGRLLQDYPLAAINDTFGSYRGVSRQDLIEVLLRSVDRERIRFGTTVEDLGRGSGAVTFSDGSSASYDLVVAADGLGSPTRDQLLDRSEVQRVDTGWGGWVTWLDEDPEPAYDEYWGPGSFLGLYPVRGRIGVFAGGPVEEIRAAGLPAFAERLAGAVDRGGDLPQRALATLANAADPYFWAFEDRRSQVWHRDGVVLLGDAATGFLPTAGVGASMAMDSAAALADELSRMDLEHRTFALDLYERRQRDRVERAQRDSRRFGRIMFVRSRLLAALRDRAVPRYRVERMLADLTKVMQGD